MSKRMNKYKESFQVDEIPYECPICGTDLDLSDIDISPYEDGF